MFTLDDYLTQRCEVHNKTIIYFKSNKMLDQTMCWECVRDANKRKRPPEEVIDISNIEMNID
jgi:hypothetical protein